MAKSILLIGGLDTSGGAGLAVDVRVAGALKTRAFTVATCLAIQSDQSFQKLKPLSSADIMNQMSALKGQNLGAIKIGALGALDFWPELIEELKSFRVPIVVDPVMTSSSGAALVEKAGKDELRNFYGQTLAPLTALLTPNYPEALQFVESTEALSGKDLALKISADFKCPVLLKGGHAPQGSGPIIHDVLAFSGQHKSFQTLRLDKGNVRGTGCALATAIACHMAAQKDPSPFHLEFAVKNALNFLGNAIKNASFVGSGVLHLFPESSRAGVGF